MYRYIYNKITRVGFWGTSLSRRNYRDSAFVFGGLNAFIFLTFFCFCLVVVFDPDWKAFQLSTRDCRDSSKFFCHSRSIAACASADNSSSRFLFLCSTSRVANSRLWKLISKSNEGRELFPRQIQLLTKNES